MQTLVRAATASGSAGLALPGAFPQLEQAGFRFRRGQVTLVAAAPGRGKSVLALTLALRTRAPTLYMSADTDSVTMLHRLAAMVSQQSVASVMDDYEMGAGALHDSAVTAASSHIRWAFDPAPSGDDLVAEVESFAHCYGEWPALLVMDNLANLKVGDVEPEGTRGLEDACDFLHEMARETGACILALHHLTGQYDNGDDPSPLSGLRGKVSKVPEGVLTLFGDMGAMGVAVVKNRTGPADQTGKLRVLIPYEPALMRLG